MAKRRKTKRVQRKRNSVIKQIVFPIWNFFVSKLWIIVVLGVLIGAGYLIVGIVHANTLFMVKHVELTITGSLAKEEIIGQLNLREGMNIFDVNIKRNAQQLESLARVKRAEVRRHLPDTISVTVIERIPIAQMKVPGRERYYLIDKEGYVIPPVTKTPHEHFVIIEDHTSHTSSLMIGESYYSDTLESAFVLLDYFSGHQLLNRHAIVLLKMETGDHLSIVYDDGLEIRFGSAIRSALEKLEKMQHVLNTEERAHIDYIDLRFKDPVVKRK